MLLTTTWTWCPKAATRTSGDKPAGFVAATSIPTERMSQAQLLLLSRAGLIRTSRRGGFCPACRLFRSGDAPQEIAAPALIALAFLVIAALAWGVTIAQMSSMPDTTMTSGMGMSIGPGSFGRFVVTWTIMMVAMMIPAATPLVFEFARTAERRRGWRTATALLGASYLAVWLVFGDRKS